MALAIASLSIESTSTFPMMGPSRGNYQQQCGNVRLAEGSFYHGLKKEYHSPHSVAVILLFIIFINCSLLVKLITYGHDDRPIHTFLVNGHIRCGDWTHVPIRGPELKSGALTTRPTLLLSVKNIKINLNSFQVNKFHKLVFDNYIIFSDFFGQVYTEIKFVGDLDLIRMWLFLHSSR